MPHRKVVAKKLGKLLSAISNPYRIRIIAELKDKEMCVTELKTALELASSGVSHHLSVLKALGVVKERREGHHVYYRLVHRDLAPWLIDGVKFIEPDSDSSKELARAITLTKSKWLGADKVSSRS